MKKFQLKNSPGDDQCYLCGKFAGKDAQTVKVDAPGLTSGDLKACGLCVKKEPRKWRAKLLGKLTDNL